MLPGIIGARHSSLLKALLRTFLPSQNHNEEDSSGPGSLQLVPLNLSLFIYCPLSQKKKKKRPTQPSFGLSFQQWLGVKVSIFRSYFKRK